MWSDSTVLCTELLVYTNTLLFIHCDNIFSLQNLRDILRKLLKSSKSKRLGKTRGGTAAVMKHKWYRSV
jgi:hypothetical protein